MAWLLKLRNLISSFNQKQERVNSINLSDVSNFLKNLELTLITNNQLERELMGYITELRQKRWQLECYLDDWHKKINSIKREQVHNFFVKTRRIMEVITFSNQPSFTMVLEFQDKLGFNLNALIREIEQSSFVHDFGFLENNLKPHHTPVNPLLQELLLIDNLRDQFEQKLSKTGMRAISVLKKKEVELQTVLRNLVMLNGKKNDRTKWLEITAKKRREKQDQLTALELNPAYQNYLKSKRKQDERSQLQQNLDQEIRNFFAPLQELLLGYVIDPQVLSVSKKYALDPVAAFMEDENLSIKHVLQYLLAQLHQNKLDLTAEQAHVLHGRLQQVSSGKLESLKVNILGLSKELPLPIGSDLALAAKVEELTYRLEHFTSQENRITEDVSEIEGKIQSLHEIMNKELDLFQNLAQINFRRQIHITYSY
tara:strand:- start:782 stop:2059 length:1278 start_codon:yes stop_codon:yes gene_type:complete